MAQLVGATNTPCEAVALWVLRRHPDPSLEQTPCSMKLLLAYAGLRVQSQADAGQLPRMEGRLGICASWNLFLHLAPDLPTLLGDGVTACRGPVCLGYL